MLPLMCAAWGKRYIFTKRLIARKKITSIKTQASESIFLHEFSIYIHFMLSKTIESAMLKFMALGKPDKIEDLTEPVAESGWSHPFVLAGHVTHLNICSYEPVTEISSWLGLFAYTRGWTTRRVRWKQTEQNVNNLTSIFWVFIQE